MERRELVGAGLVVAVLLTAALVPLTIEVVRNSRAPTTLAPTAFNTASVSRFDQLYSSWTKAASADSPTLISRTDALVGWLDTQQWPTAREFTEATLLAQFAELAVAESSNSDAAAYDQALAHGNFLYYLLQPAPTRVG
jgi:hypothetical protein